MKKESLGLPGLALLVGFLREWGVPLFCSQYKEENGP